MIQLLATATLFSILAAATAVRADTLLTVTDGFDGASLDLQKWSITAKKPAASLIFAAQRLNYVTTASPSDDD